MKHRNEIVSLLALSGYPFSGASAEQIAAFEQGTGLAMPRELSEWLFLCNGTRAGEGGLFGVDSCEAHLSIGWMLELYPEWKKRGWFPVGSDGCGNYYVMCRDSVADSWPISFIDTGVNPESLAYAVGSSVGHFLLFILEEQHEQMNWPFDKDFVLDRDPEFAKITIAPLPW